MALWFPHLATDRILRARLGRFWRLETSHDRNSGTLPIVVSHREDNTQRVHALDEQAAALGLRRGMGIADARAMHPSIEIVEADPGADRRMLEALADWCDRYTPLVAVDGTDGLFLDIAGCAHLFGGEEAMLSDAAGRLVAQGFDARGGVASTPGAAWAAARYGLPPVPPGAEAAMLAPLHLSALRLDPATRAGLESVGLRTVGPVIATPRAPLARRFGKALIWRIDQALGHVDEPISPRLGVPQLSVERILAEPVSRLEDVERLLLMLAISLKSDLERRGEGARELQLSLFRVDGAVSRIAVGATRPVRDPASIGRLFREKLAACGDDIDAGFGFDLVRLAVLSAGPFDAAQADLVAGSPDGWGDMAFFADRLRARLGEDAVLQAMMVESHLPERAVRDVPFDAATVKNAHPMEGAKDPACAERPIRLFTRPEPVAVTAEVPDGPPAWFRWRRVSYRVARAEGPERIAPEWWRDDCSLKTRDYFRIEDEEGRRYWLYREGFYGTADPPDWFVHGVFA